MTDEKNIEQLLGAFYEGTTTPEEEEIIMQWLNRNELNETFHDDRNLLNMLHNPTRIALPKGFSERLETAIDKHITDTAKQNINTKVRKLYISILSVAAVALLCIGLFILRDKPAQSNFLADTYTNPVEAAMAAEQALLLVSSKLNLGLSPFEKVKENIQKTNELINENITIH